MYYNIKHNKLKAQFCIFNVLKNSFQHVLKKKVPLSILSDSQIKESIKIGYAGVRKLDFDILKEIKYNCHDPKQFSRLMNLIEEHL